MTTFALVNAFSYVDGHDFTGDTNNLQLALEAESRDVTTFRSDGWREFVGALKTITFQQRGFWQSGTGQVDPDAFNNLGVRDRVHTMSGRETETDPAYMFRAGQFTYQLFGELGEAAPFTLGSQGTNGVGVVRGQLAVEVKQFSSTTAIPGTELNLGEVASDQHLYATIHVFTAGTSITVDLFSAADQAFSTPTQQASFTLTETGGMWMTPVAGPITDTWYKYEISAITGTFVIAGAIGIQ